MKDENIRCEESYCYCGELGAVYSVDKTVFKVWSPAADKAFLNLYEKGEGENLLETVQMRVIGEGVWCCEKTGNLDGVYYTYLLEIDGITNETVDIYAKAVGVNGNRGMVVNLEATNPEGFAKDTKPPLVNETDAVVYELHIRDISMDTSSGIKNKGKFIGLTEKGTKNDAGLSTGIDHICELGVTHVQLLPCFDYATIDEADTENSRYNWGYDPKNYNVPEGSYSTDAFAGTVRIREFKELVRTMHARGIRVNMDVVYNHTYDVRDSWFQKTVPDYYFRKDTQNPQQYSNGSGCGNETASERFMMKKFIVDSVCYWAQEYHIDGFRFDLMAVHDLDTMRAVREALDKIDSSIMVYGEGWTGGRCALPYSQQTTKLNIDKIDRIGVFNDDIRDAVKGSVFFAPDKGFISGKQDMEEAVKFGVVGAVSHPGLKTKGWSKSPLQSINYVSCHDNLTFWDKLALSNPDDSVEDRIKMTKLGAAVIFLSQGIVFLQAGEEMLRSKPVFEKEGEFDENSYASPDYTNSIKWNNKTLYNEVYEYYKGLIQFRKSHGELKLKSAEDIITSIRFMDSPKKNMVVYSISDSLLIIFNANSYDVEVNLPKGKWNIYINGNKAGLDVIERVSGSIQVAGISALVLKSSD